MANIAPESNYPVELAEFEADLITQRRNAIPLETSHRETSPPAASIPTPAATQPNIRIGLALSGGGIRSATFALGFMQQLARKQLLRRVDFLSTVSGGGYIGSFWGRLVQECQSVVTAEEQIASTASIPVSHLLRNGRYLAPGGSDDMGIAISYFLRSLILVQLMYFALMLTAAWLLLPITASMNELQSLLVGSASPPSWWSVWFALSVLGVAIFLVCAIAYYAAPMYAGSGEESLQAQWLVQLSSKLMRQAFAKLGMSLATVLHHETKGDVPREDNAVNQSLLKLRRRLTRGQYYALLMLVIGLVLGILERLYSYLLNTPWSVVWTQFGSYWAGAFALAESASLFAQRFFEWFGRNEKTKSAVPMQLLTSLAAIIVMGSLAAAAFTCAAWSWQELPQWLATPAEVTPELERPANPVPPVLTSPTIASSTAVASTSFAIPEFLQSSLPFLENLGMWALVAFLLASIGTWVTLVNSSSLHNFYYSRLARTFLGASKAISTTDLPTDADVHLGDYEPERYGGPVHLINCTINETVEGDSRQWRPDRKGLNLAVARHVIHVGARHHRFEQKNRADWTCGLTTAGHAQPLLADLHDRERLSLGRWTAISGAAFSTGLGSMTHWSTSVLCALFNVRLGYWWRARPQALKHFFSQRLYVFMARELIGRFPGTRSAHWYLTDGGHFENMGGYELIRRRIERIIIVDGECDDRYQFEGLAVLVRKARLDFNCDIQIIGFIPAADNGEPVTVLRGELDAEALRCNGARALLAKGIYLDAKGQPDGSICDIVYVKPAMIGNEALDVRHYRWTNQEFPHQTTLDQFFDEAQWESYRKLGEQTSVELQTVLSAHFSRNATQ